MMNQETGNFTPMNDEHSYAWQKKPDEGSVGKGLLGALIGAAIGAIPWAILYMLGYVAAFGGLIITGLSSSFYAKFGGKKSGVMLAILALALVFGIVLGQALGFTGDLVKLYGEQKLREDGVSCVYFVQHSWETYLLFDQETALRRDYERKLDALTPLERSGDNIMTVEEFIDEYYDTEVDVMREEMREDFGKNVLLGLFFGALGALGIFRRAYKDRKA